MNYFLAADSATDSATDIYFSATDSNISSKMECNWLDSPSQRFFSKNMQQRIFKVSKTGIVAK